MAITIPDRTKIRVTTDEKNGMQKIPAVAKVAITNPGPVAVTSSGAGEAGNAACIQAAGAAGRAGYLGFNLVPNVPVGSSLGVIKSAIVEGFAGMTPGSSVFIDATSADASGTASGMTHTAPTIATDGATADTPGIGRIGVAITATKLWID